MSTILKALKRLDEQRRADVPPRTLEEQVLAGGASPPEGASSSRNKWRWVALGVSASLLALAVGWYGRRERTGSPAVAPPPVAAQPVEVPPAVTEPPRGSLPMRDRPVAGVDLDPTVRDALRAESARGDVARGVGAVSALPAEGEPLEAAAETEAEPASRVEARAQRVAAAPASSPARSAAPRANAAPARESEVPPASVPAHVASEPTPARAEVAVGPATPPASAPEPVASVALAYPEVWVERTQWHPAPEKRSALVRVGGDAEARELREGDALGGVVVKEIRPSGVLFLYEGHEFRRGVGGS